MKRKFKIRVFILLISAIITLVLSLFPSQNIQSSYAATDGTWYLNDTNVGAEGGGRSIHCPATDDCKIAYYDSTNGALKLFDCDDATCSTGTINFLDGIEGCTITNCSTTASVGPNASIYCVASDDCKISYFDDTGNDFMFIDCDDATCSTGTRTLLDGGSGCTLTNCSTSLQRGSENSIFCPSSTDCKMVYSGGASNPGLRFADCDDAACSTGTSTLVDLGSGCTATGCSTSNTVSTDYSMYCIDGSDCKLSYYVSSTIRDLKFVDCANATCSSGQARLLDGGVGCVLTNCSTSESRGQDPSISCPTTDDCKIAYGTLSNTNLRFADCDDATCSSGTSTLIDGAGGCTLSGCGAVNRGNPSLHCPSATDCKISYQDWGNYNLRFADCDDATCSTGTATAIDGTASCALDYCQATNVTEYRSAVYCLSGTDCKIFYYEIANTNIWMADCSNATCSTGSTMTLDGHFATRTIGGAANFDNYFGEYISGKVTRMTYVSEEKFPSEGNTVLGSGTYAFNFLFDTNIDTSMDWEFSIGYCSISDNCTSKTPVVTSDTIEFTSANFAPFSTNAIGGSNLTIPGPDSSKRIYFDAQITEVVDFPFLFTYFNGSEDDFANTYFTIPAAPSSTPTPTPTPTPAPTTTPSNNSGSNSTPTPTTTLASCTMQIPTAIPFLFQVEPDKTSTSIYFVPGNNPFTIHRISYGTNPNAQGHDTILNNQNTTGAFNIRVNDLLPLTKYYFKVRVENGCMPGEWSNILTSEEILNQKGFGSKIYYSDTVENINHTESKPQPNSKDQAVNIKEIEGNDDLPENKSFFQKIIDFLFFWRKD